jgi:hypothetical protein
LVAGVVLAAGVVLNAITTRSKKENRISMLKPATKAIAKGVVVSFETSSVMLNQPKASPAIAPSPSLKGIFTAVSPKLIRPIGVLANERIMYMHAPRSPYNGGNIVPPSKLMNGCMLFFFPEKLASVSEGIIPLSGTHSTSRQLLVKKSMTTLMTEASEIAYLLSKSQITASSP